MSSLLDRDPFTSFLRTLEARLPRLVEALNALREKDVESLYSSAVSNTVFETIVDRALEERWDLEKLEHEAWNKVIEVFSEIKNYAPEEYAPLLRAFETSIDLENLLRVASGARPSELLELGTLKSCLSREGASLEQCLLESNIARFVSPETLSKAASDPESLLYVATAVKLRIAKEVLDYFENRGLDLPAIESVRNELAYQLAHIASFCSITQCPEAIAKAVRDALGIELDGSKAMVRSRSGEEIIEAVERARESRNSIEELIPLVRNCIKVLSSVGEGADLLQAIIYTLYLGLKLVFASYALKSGVVRV